MAAGQGTPAWATKMILEDVSTFRMPERDGDIRLYSHPEVEQTKYFNKQRRVIFINGMDNTSQDHARSALALSFVQMCPVLGIYNKTNGRVLDFLQCVADKRQFNGPSTWMTPGFINQKILAANLITRADAIEALSRNEAQVELFNLLLIPHYRKAEIFAHSQGNLILSNVLQAIGAVYGLAGLAGRVVHTFGSPAVNWPAGITKFEHGFTFDIINWMSGLDKTFTISKVGSVWEASNPFAHSFLEYLRNDPEFLVNRFRIGMFGKTLKMDHDGLANCLLAMGDNLSRVTVMFEHLKSNYDTEADSDGDKVAMLYVRGAMADSRLAITMKGHAKLLTILIRILSDRTVSVDARKAVDFLMSLYPDLEPSAT